MKAMNRVDGAVRAITGLGMMAAALCSPWLLPVSVWGGIRFGSGLAQLVTGWADDDED